MHPKDLQVKYQIGFNKIFFFSYKTFYFLICQLLLQNFIFVVLLVNIITAFESYMNKIIL